MYLSIYEYLMELYQFPFYGIVNIVCGKHLDNIHFGKIVYQFRKFEYPSGNNI